MKFPTLILLLFLVPSHSAFSSSRQDKVITLSDTLYGEVLVDFTANKIRLRSENIYHFLPASQVKWIWKEDRHFCVAAFGEESDYLIFEVLSQGSKALLYREGVKFNPYDEQTYPPFFVLKGRSAYSVGTKKDVLSVLYTYEKQVRDFAKTQGLSFTRKSDLSRIFDFYNGYYRRPSDTTGS